MINIALTDDEALFLQGLEMILERDLDLRVLFKAQDGTDLLEKLSGAEVLPDIILLDLRMKPMNGIETTQHLKKKYPEIKVIVLTTYYQNSFIGNMLKAGVSAFLSKNTDADKLIYAIRRVHEKEIYFTENDVLVLRQHAGKRDHGIPLFDSATVLTQRESEVLSLICEEFTTGEIADKLSLSTRTVEGHRNNMLAKTGAKNTAGLVIFAICNRLIDMEQKLLALT
jgi:DNA-binding NarL/FixJ family response regulator